MALSEQTCKELLEAGKRHLQLISDFPEVKSFLAMMSVGDPQAQSLKHLESIALGSYGVDLHALVHGALQFYYMMWVLKTGEQ